MANGHLHVAEYPLCEIAREAARVRTRTDFDLAVHMSTLQEAVGSVLSEKAGTRFKKTIERLLPKPDK